MSSAFEFCLPTKSASVPAGPDWFHEVKYDGYRLRLERDGDRVLGLEGLVSKHRDRP
jgi:ATP-dependent DNA ligase